MFVELYKPKCNIEPGKPTITVDDVWPAVEVVNIDYIETIDIPTTEFGSVSYHRVKLKDTQIVYITDAAYERLIH